MMNALMFGLLWSIILLLDSALSALPNRTTDFVVGSTTDEPSRRQGVDKVEDIRTTMSTHLFQISTTTPAAAATNNAQAVTVTTTTSSKLTLPPDSSTRIRLTYLVANNTTPALNKRVSSNNPPLSNVVPTRRQRIRFRKPRPIMFSDMERMKAFSRAAKDEQQMFTANGQPVASTSYGEPVKFPRFDGIQRRVGGGEERSPKAVNRQIFGDSIVRGGDKFAKLFTEILQNSDAIQRAPHEDGGSPLAAVPLLPQPQFFLDNRQPQNTLYLLPARPGSAGYGQQVPPCRTFRGDSRGEGLLNVAPPSPKVVTIPTPSTTEPNTMNCCGKATNGNNNNMAVNPSPIPTAPPCTRNQPMAETNEKRNGCRNNNNNDQDLLDQLIGRIAQRESESGWPTARRWHSARSVGGDVPPSFNPNATTRGPYNSGGGIQQAWQNGCEHKATIFHGINACTTSFNNVDITFDANAINSAPSSYTPVPRWYHGGSGYHHSCGDYQFNPPPNTGDKFYVVDSIINPKNNKGFLPTDFTNPFYQSLPSLKWNNRLMGGLGEPFSQHTLSVADASADVLMNYLYENHQSMTMDEPCHGK